MQTLATSLGAQGPANESLPPSRTAILLVEVEIRGFAAPAFLFSAVAGIEGRQLTNGALLETMAETLVRFKILKIQISCNAATRETYKQVHRVDDFDRVCSGIRAIKYLKPDVYIRMKMVYMRPNIGDLAVYPALAKSLGADEVRFSNMTFFPKADASQDDAYRATDQDWSSVESDIGGAAARLTELGIVASVRRPGQKRLDNLEDWDDE